MHTKLIEACSVNADIRERLLIIYSVIMRHLREKKENNRAFRDSNKTCDSVKWGFIQHYQYV